MGLEVTGVLTGDTDDGDDGDDDVDVTFVVVVGLIDELVVVGTPPLTFRVAAT